METQLPDAYALLLVDLRTLKAELIDLRDRVAVLEERTCDHENRLEDLEEKADGDDWIDGAD